MPMTLSQIREKYPQYDSKSDQELADALHSKYYSSMPKGDFYQKMGLDLTLDEKATKGGEGIWEDIKESVSGLPSTAANLIRQLPGQAYGSAKQLVTHPIRAAENLAAGLGEGAIGALNIPANVGQYLASKDIISPETAGKIPSVPDLGIEKALGLDQPQEGDALLRGLTSFLPYARAGKLAGGLKGVGQRAAAAGAYGAGQNIDPLQAALMGVAGEGAAGAIKGASNLRPSRSLRGTLSPEELAQNLEATQGTNTGLGNVIDSPFLQRQLENVYSKQPLSGAVEKMQGTAEQVRSQGQKLVEDLVGGTPPENIGDTLANALKQSERDIQATKREKYKRVNELAEKENVQTERSALRAKADEVLKQVESDPDLAAFRNKSDLSLLQKIATQEAKPQSLQKTDYLRSELGERAHEAFVNGDKVKGNLYKDLKSALEQDIDSAIESTGSKELKAAREEAHQFYKDEVVPYEEPEILKFTRKGADPDLLASYFLRTGKHTDRAKLLSQLLSKLPNKSSRDLLPYSYFSHALEEGQLNPLKLKTLYKNLGENQKRALFPEKAQKRAFDNYIRLVEKNTEPLTLMFNPKTGQRSSDMMSGLFGQILGGSAGLFAGGTPGALLGTIIGKAAPGIAQRPLVNLLTSPGFREKLVGKMIENSKRPEPLRSDKLIQSIVEAAKRSNRVTAPMELYLTKAAGKKEDNNGN